jgi:competence protein ComEC
VEGKLALPKNFESENGVEFDYVNYLGKENIRYEIFRPKITFIESQRSLKGSLFDLKNKFIDSIGKFVPDPDSSLIAGVLFGSKQSLGDVLLDRFKKAGIIHIVVLSGYNITIVASAFLYAANYFGKKRQGLFGAVIAILLFGLMVGLGATVLRAMLMSLLAILARYLGRPFDALRALFIAAFAMILWNPDLLLYDPSFQLSFMATFGLITLTPFFYTRLGFVTSKYGLQETVASTLAVQVFLLPILIYMSGFVSLVSFIVNILIPPLVPAIMLGGFITGLLGLLPSYFGLIAWPFALVTFICARAMILLAEFASSLPLATVSISSFPLWLVFVLYVVGFALYRKLNKKDKPALP